MSAGVAEEVVVVVGPAPPLRGGIAAHTARLVEALQRQGHRASALSFRRLYPDALFPGRSQRVAGAATPPWCEEVLDPLDPRSWLAARRRLARSGAKVVVQWWHPAMAPAFLATTAGLGRERLVAVCHNALPHERFPAARLAARALLGRCGAVVCHSPAVRRDLVATLGIADRAVRCVPLPCLVAPEDFETDRMPPELAPLAKGTPLAVAAGHVRAYKGTALLLRAWSSATRSEGARLVVAGESYLGGRARREVAALARRDPSIILLDRYLGDDELVSLVRSASVVVAAHLTASQSGILPLARALGTPVIASSAGGLPSQLPGLDADLVPAGGQASLASALARRLAAAARGTGRARMDGCEGFAVEWAAVVEAMGIGLRPSAAAERGT